MKKFFGRRHGREQDGNTQVHFEADQQNCTQLTIFRPPPDGTVSETSSVGSDVAVEPITRSCEDLLIQSAIAGSASDIVQTDQVVSETGEVLGNNSVQSGTAVCGNCDECDAVIADDSEVAVPAAATDALPVSVAVAETGAERAVKPTQYSLPSLSALQPSTVSYVFLFIE